MEALEGGVMSAKLIVTGLCEEIRDEELYDLFDVYGPIIDVGIERDTLTSRSLGIGYVVYGEPLCAVRARLCMDGAEINGQRLGVRHAFSHNGHPHDEVTAAALDESLDGPPSRNLRARVD
jgi:RNA recognition motif-containing protein